MMHALSRTSSRSSVKLQPEYLGLTWRAVDREAGTATVRQALAKLREGWEFKEPKTP